jgi:hypothetical protein
MKLRLPSARRIWRGGKEMTAKADIWKDLAEIMSLLLELEKEHPDSRIVQAKHL